MNDRYLNYDECYNRLKRQLEEHGYIYISYDFDNTIYPLTYKHDGCPKLIWILQVWRDYGYFIMFTHRDSSMLQEAIDYVKNNDIPLDEVNSNIDAIQRGVVSDSVKPMWHIILDDTAGLETSYRLLYDLAKEKGFLPN